MVSKMWVGWELWVMDVDKWNFLLFQEIIESFYYYLGFDTFLIGRKLLFILL